MTFRDDGGSIAFGITGANTVGHSPGHMVYQIGSNDQRLMISEDTANLLSGRCKSPLGRSASRPTNLPRPQVASKSFEMIAADLITFIGDHMTSPGMG